MKSLYDRLIQGYWPRDTQTPAAAGRWVLLPLSVLFGWLAGLRRKLYRCGVLSSVKLPVPVVVVGNISVGGTGKTPLTISLAEFLMSQGFHPGVVSRGYGGSARVPCIVTSDSDPALVGEEPVLIASRLACPVWVGRDRVAAARALLAARRECDVLISDDGLQHYPLRRDMEIAVVDGERGFGNGHLLPAGPLREPVERLNGVDALVINGPTRVPIMGSAKRYTMLLRGELFHNLDDPKLAVSASHFAGKKIYAIAAIGNPGRFFSHLRGLGLDFQERAFPDHHALRADDIAMSGAQVVLMTEKDAVKCSWFADGQCWYLRVEAEIDAALGDAVLQKIGKPHGSQTA
ncbi:MAG: tetraacyldisaccharide 4'-kinase [Burkholderiales bacterium]